MLIVFISKWLHNIERGCAAEYQGYSSRTRVGFKWDQFNEQAAYCVSISNAPVKAKYF